eukprot:1966912-Rhodomonas_salina.1
MQRLRVSNLEQQTVIEYHVNPTCPRRCWKYSYPVTHNPLLSYVVPESPGLSLTFEVKPGDSVLLHIIQPTSRSDVVQGDISLSHIESPQGNVSFLSQCNGRELVESQGAPADFPCEDEVPFFLMTDRYDNLNNTDDGTGSARLVPSRHYAGASMTGTVGVDVAGGVARFPSMFISCPGPDFRITFTYTRSLVQAASETDLTSLSEPFDVLPAAPALRSSRFDNTMSKIYFEFDKPTNLGLMPMVSNCMNFVDSVVAFHIDTQQWFRYPLLTATDADAMGASNVTNATNTSAAVQVQQLIEEYDGPGLKLGTEPTCSWKSDRVLALTLGPNATIDSRDFIALKNPYTGLNIRTSTPVLDERNVTRTLASPSFTPSPLAPCGESGCGGNIVTDPKSLSRVQLHCPPPAIGETAASDSRICWDFIRGQAVQDVAHFTLGGRSWYAVASYCTTHPITRDVCLTYGTERGLVVYEMVTWQDAPKATGLFEHQSILTVGAYDLEVINIVNDASAAAAYLGVVQHFNGQHYSLS